MAVQRTVFRFGAVLAGLAALGVALPTLASTPKAARHRAAEPKAGLQKCCDVRVRDAVGTVVTVGEPAGVTATVTARRNGCTNVHPRITVSLAGLDPDEIRVERVVRGTPRSMLVRRAGAGAVQAADPVRDGLRLCGHGQANLAYRLTFRAGAPAGRATVTAEADGGGGRVLGRDATVTVVRGVGRAPAPPASTAPPTPPPSAVAPDRPAAAAPGSVVDSPSATQPEVAAGRPAGPGQPSSTLVAAGLGALVAATMALVGVLALRQRRRMQAPAHLAGAARPAGPLRRPGKSGRQPTLAARWSSLVATVRRQAGSVGGGSLGPGGQRGG